YPTRVTPCASGRCDTIRDISYGVMTVFPRRIYDTTDGNGALREPIDGPVEFLASQLHHHARSNIDRCEIEDIFDGRMEPQGHRVEDDGPGRCQIQGTIRTSRAAAKRLAVSPSTETDEQKD